MKNKEFYDLTQIDILFKGISQDKNCYDIYFKDHFEERRYSVLEPKEFTLNWLEEEHKGY